MRPLLFATSASLALVFGCSDPPEPSRLPTKLTWTEGAPSPIARFEANSAVVQGELWVMGGFTASSLEVTRRIDIYNPDSDTWREGPELPGAETHVAVVTRGDEIILAGGFIGKFEGPRLPTTSEVWRWNAAENSWASGPELPTAGAAFAWGLLGDELHLAGGLGPDGDTDQEVHHVWNVSDDSWKSAAPFPRLRNHGGAAVSGGRLIAIAGRHSWDETAGAVTDVDIYDPKTDSWSEGAPLPSPRSEIGASTFALENGIVMVIGGSGLGKSPQDEVLAYEPQKDQWTALTPLPERRKGAVAARIGKRIIVTTGSPTSTDPSNKTFIGCCL